jgi:hypothetical protein
MTIPMRKPDIAADGAAPHPPDLQILVATHGSYALITTEAWAEFDNAISEWRIERLAAIGVKPISSKEMTERRRAKRAAKKTTAHPPGAGRAVDSRNAPSKQEEQHEMDMSRYAGSSFLKPEHLADGPRIETITNVEEGGFDRPELVFESGDKLSLNKTNTRILLHAFGPNDVDWLGKSIEMSAGETTFKDQIVPTIVVKPVSPAVPKEAQQPLPEPAPRDLRDDMADEVPF